MRRMSPMLAALASVICLPALGQSSACLLSKDGPAVVQIRYSYDAGVDGNSDGGNSRGSGFIISDEGYVLTNAHVIQPTVKGLSVKSDSIVAHVGKALEAPLPLSVVVIDVANDLALLRLPPKQEGKAWPVVSVSDGADLPVGAKLTSLGFASTDLAIVSTAEKTALTTLVDGKVMPWWQTSLSLNPGNSGGPVFDSLGTVVGVAVARHDNAQLISWVIPIARARHLLDVAGTRPAKYGECAVFPECRSAAHGVDGYTVDQLHEKWSDWRGGGYNQPAYCNDLIAELRKARPQSNFEAVNSNEQKSEVSIPGAVLSARYRYYCQVRERAGPVYKMRASAACIP